MRTLEPHLARFIPRLQQYQLVDANPELSQMRVDIEAEDRRPCSRADRSPVPRLARLSWAVMREA